MATMPGVPQDTECPVCHDSFVTPKILPCGHLLCRYCIVAMKKSRKLLLCPLCINAIYTPQSLAGESPEVFADSLPTDLAMHRLAWSVKTLSTETTCCVCEGVMAESICLQCKDLFCSSCTNAHKKMSMSRSHDVESLSTVTAEHLAASFTPKCTRHRQILSFYCTNHCKSVCAVCAATDHKTCSQVTDLIGESKSAEDEVKGLANTLTEVESKMEQNIQELDIRLKESDSCQNLCTSLVTICNEQKKLLTSSNFMRLKKSMEDTKKKFRERLARVKLHKRIVSRTVVACPRPWMIRAKRYLQNSVKTLDLSTSLPEDVERTSLPQIKDFNNLARRIRSELRQQEQRQKKLEEPKFTFHTNRGYNVMLELNGLSAECQSTDGGVVVSSDPLQTNVLYEVKVMKTSLGWRRGDNTFCGITGTHPNDLNIRNRITEMDEVRCVPCNENSGLIMQTNSTVGLMVDSGGNLHIFVNDETLYIFKEVSQPCFAVFDLSFDVKKVLALPARKKP